MTTRAEMIQAFKDKRLPGENYHWNFDGFLQRTIILASRNYPQLKWPRMDVTKPNESLDYTPTMVFAITETLASLSTSGGTIGGKMEVGNLDSTSIYGALYHLFVGKVDESVITQR